MDNFGDFEMLNIMHNFRYFDILYIVENLLDFDNLNMINRHMRLHTFPPYAWVAVREHAYYLLILSPNTVGISEGTFDNYVTMIRIQTFLLTYVFLSKRHAL